MQYMTIKQTSLQYFFFTLSDGCVLNAFKYISFFSPAHLLMVETLGPVSPLDKAMEHPHSRPARVTTTRQHRATAKDNHPRHQMLPTPTRQK